jgi:hypothetical protein
LGDENDNEKRVFTHRYGAAAACIVARRRLREANVDTIVVIVVIVVIVAAGAVAAPTASAGGAPIFGATDRAEDIVVLLTARFLIATKEVSCIIVCATLSVDVFEVAHGEEAEHPGFVAQRRRTAAHALPGMWQWAFEACAHPSTQEPA